MINNSNLVWASIVEPYTESEINNGCSNGMSLVGYDITIDQDITFYNFGLFSFHVSVSTFYDFSETYPKTIVKRKWGLGSFSLASSIEHFTMPSGYCGVVYDKSTWARKGLSLFNTIIEPGWIGYLTLELKANKLGITRIKEGTGIAQVVLMAIEDPKQYTGKYQYQENNPVEAR
jgi:dCTP deaminase